MTGAAPFLVGEGRRPGTGNSFSEQGSSGMLKKKTSGEQRQQNPVDIPLYWLFNRDPYFMAYYNPHITG